MVAMLMMLPQKLLQLVFELLTVNDLWMLFEISNKLRYYIARPLFRQTDLCFTSILLCKVNDRKLPARRIFQILRDHSVEVRKLNIISNDEKIRAHIWQLVSEMPNLKHCSISSEVIWDTDPSDNILPQLKLHEFYSLISDDAWPPCSPFKSLQCLKVDQLSDGLLKIPAVETLLELVIRYHPESDEPPIRVPCNISLDFSQLPQLNKLYISHLSAGRLTLTGKSESLKCFVTGNSKIEAYEVFPTLGENLEVIRLTDTSVVQIQELGINLPHLQLIELAGCLDFLPVVFINPLASLTSIVLHYDADQLCHELPGLAKILNEFRTRSKPDPDIFTIEPHTATLSGHDGSLALFLDRFTESVNGETHSARGRQLERII